MVNMSTGNSGRFLNSEYYEVREYARTHTYGLQEWGEIDIEKYDLDTVEFTRQHKPSSYVTEVRVDAEGAAQGGKDWSDDPVDGE